MKTIKVLAEIEVPFQEYNTKSKNERAEKYIKAWIKSALKDRCSFIPLYVEKDGRSYIEDCCEKARIKVK